MASTPVPKLMFPGGCPDCGQRFVNLPSALPDVGDDFDWLVRDFSGFRRFMLEELAVRFPERTRWTAADMEVVLIEVLATVLDQLSDMIDRVQAEAFLETARRPESVRRILKLIGYDPIVEMGLLEDSVDKQAAYKTAIEKFDQDPFAVERARLQGPRSVRTQKRMVTVNDYGIRLEEHPLVLQAQAIYEWTGPWSSTRVAIIAWDQTVLDDIPEYKNTDGILEKGYGHTFSAGKTLADVIQSFHQKRKLFEPVLNSNTPPTIRTILRHYVERYRMIGQEVILCDPVYAGISMSLSIQVNVNYFQSEIQHSVAKVLGRGKGGFFEPGRLNFGEDLYASDIIQYLMTLDGIENICLNRFKRVGKIYPDRVKEGFIPFNDLEIAVCDNVAGEPGKGYYTLILHGGRKG